MEGRRAVAAAKRSGDTDEMRNARTAVDEAKRALGERGSVWWDDGDPDLNQKMARDTPYAEWISQQQEPLALPRAVERMRSRTRER